MKRRQFLKVFGAGLGVATISSKATGLGLGLGLGLEFEPATASRSEPVTPTMQSKNLFPDAVMIEGGYILPKHMADQLTAVLNSNRRKHHDN